MEGLFSLLIFAAFFYVMMRFGCGAHMMRGHCGPARHGRDTHEQPSATASAADRNRGAKEGP